MDAVQVSLRRLKRPAIAARKWGLALVLLSALAAGAWLRWPVLAVNRFHEDEALYSTWALQVADGIDPWLERVLVDKPPLLPYLLAGLFRLLGPSEVVARLPGLIAGLGSILCLYGLARRLYGERTALLAAWLLALSPFHISLSGTAFTDPVMVFWVLASLWAAAARRLPLAGGCAAPASGRALPGTGRFHQATWTAFRPTGLAPGAAPDVSNRG